jgi:hypothetical protein
MPKTEFAGCQMVLLVVQSQLSRGFQLICTQLMMLEFRDLKIAPQMVYLLGQIRSLQEFNESVSRSQLNIQTALNTIGPIRPKCQ